MVTVQLLGSPCLRSGGEVLAGPPAQRHRLALLTLVVDAWPHPLPRDRALALLWPERDASSGRRLLNLAVHVLRSALGERALTSLGDGLVWTPDGIDCDLHHLREAIAGGDAAAVAAAWRGPLLDGFHLPESVEFDQWLAARRDELARAHVRALQALADAAERTGDTPALLGALARLVDAEPHSPAPALRYMRALEASGDRVGAIRHAAAHAARLRRDLDLDPDPAVTALERELRSAPLAPGRAPAVAVLPFLSIGADPQHEYFADGVTEDVIAHLTRIRSLKVIARASVMPFRSREQPLREIGRTLGTQAVLDGSVRHVGNRVRIVATLVDVDSARQLWSETYDRQLEDIFAIQTDVALRIAAALRAELSPEERGRVAAPRSRDVEAHRLYQLARRFYFNYSADALTRSVETLDIALARHPRFAEAHALRALALINLAEYGDSPSALYADAAGSVAQALEQDPELAEALTARGHLRMVREYDWTAAEADMRAAIELSPGSVHAHEWLTRLLAAAGRHDDALEQAALAQELDPLSQRNDRTTVLLRAGRYDEAFGWARDMVEVMPQGAREQGTFAWACYFTGRSAQAVAALERAVDNASREAMWLGQLGQLHGLLGHTARARAIVAELGARSRQRFVSPFVRAYPHVGLGEHHVAMDLLEEAVALRSGAVYGVKTSFLFAPLRGHPRFAALLRQMNQ